jgi:hypothetical protein
MACLRWVVESLALPTTIVGPARVLGSSEEFLPLYSFFVLGRTLPVYADPRRTPISFLPRSNGDGHRNSGGGLNPFQQWRRGASGSLTWHRDGRCGRRGALYRVEGSQVGGSLQQTSSSMRIDNGVVPTALGEKVADKCVPPVSAR